LELPLDHFRLIGVSPSATSEEILRAFQLRLDKTPNGSFSYEVLTQRSELLRLTADLLTDPESRREYENLLLKGATGLEFPSNREVAGLILLWESGSPKEAFKIARKALQPPQTPALGSSREADLTLLAALTARDSAIQEQKLRSYSSSADFLHEGIKLLQRMGKLAELRIELEEDLTSLLPYRILDLLSRDLNDQESHKKGLSMLENLIIKRGGLEGNNKSEYGDYLNQKEFEDFFQQIRPYLTVQEQIDLFLELQKRGSLEAGFLAFLSLTAIGFSRRKPEKLYEARKILKKINLPGFDSMPLKGCLDLLLADIEHASEKFLGCSDEKLRSWITNNYPEDNLEAICVFCKNWLENDVLVGYRDIDVKEVNLDLWFEDREIQEFIEKLEKKSNKTRQNSRLHNQSKFVKDFSQKSDGINSSNQTQFFDENTLPWPGGIKEQNENQINQDNNSDEELHKNKSLNFYKFLIEKIAEFKFSLGEFLENKFTFNNPTYKTFFYAFLILFGIGIGVGLLRNKFIKTIQNDISINKPTKIVDKNKELVKENTTQENIKTSFNKPEENISLEVIEITKASPSIKEIKYLIETWLSNKSNYMAGKAEINLSGIVKDSLLKRTIEEREKDIEKGFYKEISSDIQEIVLKSQTSSRIVAVAELKYRERIFNNNGELVNETILNPLKVKYILGFSNKSWKLADFVNSP